MSSFSSKPTFVSAEEPAQRPDDSYQPLPRTLDATTEPSGLSQTIVISATFTAEPLAEVLDFWLATLGLPAQLAFAPYNQVFQQLLDPTSLLARNQHGVNLLLVRWEDWQQTDHDHPADAAAPDQGALIEQHAQRFRQALQAVAARSAARFLVALCPPTPTADPRVLALCATLDAAAVADLAPLGNVTVLTSTEIQQRYPVADYYDAHSDALGHIPFTPPFFTALGTSIARTLYAAQHPPYKVVVLDCDQTLWGGVCGEDGVHGITLDAPRLALQQFMVRLQEAGMLLCLCSKNTEADVLAVFEQRAELVLTRQHLVSWRINWQPKSANLRALAEELQLGLDSFIFVDDNPLECAEVQAHCPEVLTLQLPDDPNDIEAFLAHVWAFDRGRLTAEDRQRTQLYQQNLARQRAQTSALTLDDFLAELGLEVQIQPLTAPHLARVAQLTQRTNQFNLTTIRRSEGEIQAFCQAGGECLTVTVADKFGDYGLVGVVLFTTETDAIVVDTLLLSCRVLGKRVEHQILAHLGALAQARGLATVRLGYEPTARNQPAKAFLDSLGAAYHTATATGLEVRLPSAVAATIASQRHSTPLTPPTDVLIDQATAPPTTPTTNVLIGPAPGPQPTNSATDVLIGQVAGPLPTNPVVAAQTKTTLLRQIALELRTVEQIHQTIAAQRRRSRDGIDQTFVAPRTPAETHLSAIWAEVLGLDRVGIHDNFFSLGGQSLLGTRLLSRVRDAFQVELSQGALFEAPTIAELNALITQTRRGQNGHGGEILPIPALPRQQPTTAFPLSFAQQRLWFLEQLQASGTAYNDTLALRLKGELNNDILEAGLNAIVRRHETLRTTFQIERGDIMQIVGPAQPLAVTLIDLQQVPAEQREAELIRQAHQDVERPFDLTAGPLFRATLYRLAANEHLLLLCMHHIVSDGWSWGVLCRELSAAYQHMLAGTTITLADLPIQYADFALWQREYLERGVLADQISYWRQQLHPAPSGHGTRLPALELPTDHPRPAVSSAEGDSLVFMLPAELSAQLAVFNQREGVTLFMTLLAAFQAVLARYSQQTDLAVGTPIANRTRREIEGLIGFFVNTLVLRSRFGLDWSFRELLRHVREVAIGAYAHQDVPFEHVVDAVQPERDLSRHPLFQVMFVLQNEPLSPLSLPDVAVERFDLPSRTSKFDLTLTLEETPTGLSGHVEFCTALFERATIERLVGHFQALLAGAIADPDRQLMALPLLTEPEREQLLAWNATGRAYAADRCIHELVEWHAAQRPDATAVVCEDQRLSYEALNARANQLAHYLRQQGVGPEVRVGLYVERSLEMVVGVLGILKAGGAYVPIDRSYPADRIRFMVQDAQVPVVITQQHLRDDLAEQSTQLVCLDADWDRIALESSDNPSSGATPDSLAYVIYTSGSTGRPKGVLVTHANVVRLLTATDDWFHFGPDDVWTLFHSIAFDFSVWEVWGALCYGGRLVVVPYLVSRSPEAFYELVAAEQVTVLNQTPSAFRQFIQAEGMAERRHDLALRYVIFGGEALNLQDLQPWYDRHDDQQPLLVNMYGITETTVHVTYRPLRAEDVRLGAGSVIGGPIPDLQLYILDEQLQPLPIGVPGEMFVGGAGVARGYLNRPELTMQRFIPNPFTADSSARLYRSGDLARYLANGDIEYLGRIDHQVKIRGFRIELGEIESALAQHPGVRQAVVTVYEPPSSAGGYADKRLVGYVVPRQAALPATNDLRDFLLGQLPDYMVPAVFVPLDTLPLTTNGKLDRKALPKPDLSLVARQDTFVAPRTPAEEVVAQIWGRLLHMEQVGIHDNFFDLGGNSLLATRVIVRLHEVFQLKVPVRSLFDKPTIAGLVTEMAELWGGTDALDTLNEVALLYQQLANLSEEEVAAMLAAQS